MRFSFEASGRDFSGVCATVRALVSQRLLIAFAPAQPMYSGPIRKRVRYRSVPEPRLAGLHANIRRRDNVIGGLREGCAPSGGIDFLSDRRMQLIW